MSIDIEKMGNVKKIGDLYMCGHLRKFSFKDIDLLDLMTKVTEGHVKHYKSDFYQFDVPKFMETAKSGETVSYIWLVRESGTWLLSERGVFMRNTPTYEHLHYYVEWEPDAVIAAFEVRVKGVKDDLVYGDICTVDLEQYWRCVNELAQDTKDIILQYEAGREIVPKGTAIPGPDPHPEYGKFQYYDYTVEDEAELKRLVSMGWKRLQEAMREIA